MYCTEQGYTNKQTMHSEYKQKQGGMFEAESAKQEFPWTGSSVHVNTFMYVHVVHAVHAVHVHDSM